MVFVNAIRSLKQVWYSLRSKTAVRSRRQCAWCMARHGQLYTYYTLHAWLELLDMYNRSNNFFDITHALLRSKPLFVSFRRCDTPYSSNSEH